MGDQTGQRVRFAFQGVVLAEHGPEHIEDGGCGLYPPISDRLGVDDAGVSLRSSLAQAT